MDVTMLGQNLLYGLMNGAGYALFAIGLVLTFGIMRVINFAHGELYMLGAMLVFALTRYLGLNLFTAAAIGIATVAGGGYIVNRFVIQPMLSTSALAPLLSTLALSLVMLYGSEAILTAHPRVLPSPFTGVIHVAGLVMPQTGLAVIIVGLAVGVGFYIFLEKATLGKQMRATVQSLSGARLIGIDTKRIYTYTLVISAGLAALGGILLAFLHTASVAMGQTVLIKGFVIVVVAGMGNLFAATIVAVVIGLLESLFVFYTAEQYAPAFLYLVMIAVLLLRPQGLFVARRG